MMKNRTLILVAAVVLLSTAVMANFMAAFSSPIALSDEAKESQQEPKGVGADNTKKSSLASVDDFKMWLASYKGVGNAEKSIVYGMMEQNASKAENFFKTACNRGDERGCFQLALNQIGQKNAEGLGGLSDLATHGKNEEIALKSAQLLGSYVLDFAPNNKNAVSLSIEAVMPYAAKGDAGSQFLAAHLLATNGVFNEADDMLTKACSNPNSEASVIEYCRAGQNVEMVTPEGAVVGRAQKEAGGCSK